jgi:hypothetical protein
MASFFARIIPAVLLPEPGMPINTIFESCLFISVNFYFPIDDALVKILISDGALKSLFKNRFSK